ncbi:SDR family oxidoreductase [Myxococcota bacterium]
MGRIPMIGGTTLLFGANSLSGWALLQRRGFASLEPHCNRNSRLPQHLDWGRVNLQDRQALADVLAKHRPDRIIDCSGICRVETCERSPDFAFEVNVVGVRNLLDLLPEQTHLIYCSNDHVFGGGNGPYGESSPPTPINIYGKTRAIAETDIRRLRPDALILRIGVLVGGSHNRRRGDIDWMRYRTAHRLPITYVTDERRNVAWSADVADRIAELAEKRTSGIRHIVGRQTLSRVTLAEYLNERFDIGARFVRQRRNQRSFPHPGHIELVTEFRDELATPLPAVMPEPSDTWIPHSNATPTRGG